MPLAIAFRIEEHALLPSTQATLKGRIEAGEDVDGLVLRARAQERGSGRRGRAWASEEGGSYQSLALRLAPGAAWAAGPVALHVALGIAEVLHGYGARVRIKWPNDLYYLGRKLAGILVETVRGHLVVGVGVNVANRPPEGTTALVGWDLQGVHAAVLEGVQRGLDAAADGAPLAARYAPFDELAGRRVEVDDGALRAGVAAGVDEAGCLLLRGEGGVTRCCRGTVRSIGGTELRSGPSAGS